MPNNHLLARLTGIQQALMGLHAAGGGMSSASKGRERENFVDTFLRACHPPPFRFGSGDVTDTDGRRSGQLDVVVEYPFAPSVTLTDTTRLYLAESVAAVIEVKSDVGGQWGEVASTAASLQSVQRRFTGGMASFGGGLNRDVINGGIPLIAVGYKGWAQLDTLKRHLSEGIVDGILVIEAGLFVSSPRLGGVQASGPWSLWGMIHAIHEATQALAATKVDILAYAR